MAPSVERIEGLLVVGIARKAELNLWWQVWIGEEMASKRDRVRYPALDGCFSGVRLEATRGNYRIQGKFRWYFSQSQLPRSQPLDDIRNCVLIEDSIEVTRGVSDMLPHARPGPPAATCARSCRMNTLNSLSKKSGAKHLPKLPVSPVVSMGRRNTDSKPKRSNFKVLIRWRNTNQRKGCPV